MGPLVKKSLTMLKKLKGGNLWDYSTSILTQDIKKLKRTLWELCFRKKSHNAKEPEKEKVFFWFSSLGQQVQIGAFLKFVELLVELFWSLQVYRKKH